MTMLWAQNIRFPSFHANLTSRPLATVSITDEHVTNIYTSSAQISRVSKVCAYDENLLNITWDFITLRSGRVESGRSERIRNTNGSADVRKRFRTSGSDLWVIRANLKLRGRPGALFIVFNSMRFIESQGEKTHTTPGGSFNEDSRAAEKGETPNSSNSQIGLTKERSSRLITDMSTRG